MEEEGKSDRRKREKKKERDRLVTVTTSGKFSKQS